MMYPGNYNGFVAAKRENRERQETEIGKREAGTVRLEAAVVAYHGALEVYEASGATNYSRLVTQNLTHAEALLAERRMRS